MSPGQAGIGGPLLDFDGKFVGMNFYDKYADGTPYLKWDANLHVLGPFEKKKGMPCSFGVFKFLVCSVFRS